MCGAPQLKEGFKLKRDWCSCQSRPSLNMHECFSVLKNHQIQQMQKIPEKKTTKVLL